MLDGGNDKMMMTSTFPGSRSNHNMNHGIKEIQSKKDALMSLETALKKRVNEFKELCLKEGELTGHLPIDYPLQPREPIPQIRRRINQSGGRSQSRTSSTSSSSISNNNLNDTNNLALPCSSIRSLPAKVDSVQSHQAVFAIPANNSLPTTNSNFPSRPTSTNSTSSSISTASSNTRSAHNAIINSQHLQLSTNPSNRNQLATTNQHTSNNNGKTHCFISNNSHYTDQVLNQLNHNNHRPVRYDQSVLPNHFKRPFNMAPASTYDSDTLGHLRASSTASSSSGSGSGTSSNLSAPLVVSNSTHISNGLNMNLHGRSCSESLTNNPTINLRPNSHMRPRSQDVFSNQMAHLHTNPDVPPARPPRGPTHQIDRQILCKDTVDGNLPKQPSSENRSKLMNTHQLQKDVSSGKPLQHFNMNGLTNFQTFLEEETKPFQMSDFYKYSSKYRQKVSDPQKTTRQLQEDVLKKNSLKYSSCDDQIQALPKLFERSGQKLIEATAKAIAGNPGLAEKLNNILPNNHRSDNRY